MNKVTTIGLDLAKNVFHIVGCNERGKVVGKKMLKRAQMLSYFANHPLCLVAMEACATSHYWGRQLQEMGFEVRLIPPQHVKAFVRGNKNDYNDALAIAEAVHRPGLHFVAIKTIDQQDLQALHRMRERSIQSRTASANQLRGLLAENGITVPQGIHHVRKRIPELLEDSENSLSSLFRRLLSQGYEQLCQLDQHISEYSKEIEQLAKQNDACKRLQTIPGFGPMVASVFYSAIGNGQAYRRGRDASASLGLVPRQHSSGGKDNLLGISKRGDRYLRSLLVQGARNVVKQAPRKDDPLSCWINRIQERRGHHKATVALANKMGRMGWAILAKQTVYKAA